MVPGINKLDWVKEADQPFHKVLGLKTVKLGDKEVTKLWVKRLAPNDFDAYTPKSI